MGVGLLEIPAQGPRGGKYDCMVWYGAVWCSIVWYGMVNCDGDGGLYQGREDLVGSCFKTKLTPQQPFSFSLFLSNSLNYPSARLNWSLSD
jgi:hypothetical protein